MDPAKLNAAIMNSTSISFFCLNLVRSWIHSSGWCTTFACSLNRGTWFLCLIVFDDSHLGHGDRQDTDAIDCVKGRCTLWVTRGFQQECHLLNVPLSKSIPPVTKCSKLSICRIDWRRSCRKGRPREICVSVWIYKIYKRVLSKSKLFKYHNSYLQVLVIFLSWCCRLMSTIRK